MIFSFRISSVFFKRKSTKSLKNVESFFCEKHCKKQKMTKKLNSVFSSDLTKSLFCLFALKTAWNSITKFFIAWWILGWSREKGEKCGMSYLAWKVKRFFPISLPAWKKMNFYLWKSDKIVISWKKRRDFSAFLFFHVGRNFFFQFSISYMKRKESFFNFPFRMCKEKRLSFHFSF